MTDTITCYCGAPMHVRASQHGRVFSCSRFPACDGAIGMHAATGKPLGIPADKATRQARIAAHAAFDQLWRVGTFPRKQAYHWMRKHLKLTDDEAHIGRFTIEQCHALVALVEAYQTMHGIVSPKKARARARHERALRKPRRRM